MFSLHLIMSTITLFASFQVSELTTLSCSSVFLQEEGALRGLPDALPAGAAGDTGPPGAAAEAGAAG